MPQAKAFIGLDTHKDSIAISIADVHGEFVNYAAIGV